MPWQLADEVLAFELDDALRESVGDAMAPFALTTEAPTVRVKLSVRPAASQPFNVDVHEAGDRVRVRAAGHYEGELRGDIATFSLASADADAVSFSLRNLVKQTFLIRLVARGGLALHAASVVHDGEAWVFFGPSGVGKTTLARCVPLRRVLNDELTVIAPDRTVYRTPYFGELGLIDGELHAPLRRLFALAQAEAPVVQPLDRGTAWRALLKHAAWFAGLPGLTPRLAETCLALAPLVEGRFGTPLLDTDRFAEWLLVRSRGGLAGF